MMTSKLRDMQQLTVAPHFSVVGNHDFKNVGSFALLVTIAHWWSSWSTSFLVFYSYFTKDYLIQQWPMKPLLLLHHSATGWMLYVAVVQLYDVT